MSLNLEVETYRFGDTFRQQASYASICKIGYSKIGLIELKQNYACE